MQDSVSMTGRFSEQFGKKNNCVNFIAEHGETYFVFLSEKQIVPVGTRLIAQFSISSYKGVEKRDGEHEAYVGIRPRQVLRFEEIKK